MLGRQLRHPPPPPSWLARHLRLSSVAAVVPCAQLPGWPQPRRRFSLGPAGSSGGEAPQAASSSATHDVFKTLFRPPPGPREVAPRQQQQQQQQRSPKRGPVPADHEPLPEVFDHRADLRSLDDHPLLKRPDALRDAMTGLKQEKHEALHGEERRRVVYRRGQLRRDGIQEAQQRMAEENRAKMMELMTEDLEGALFLPDAADLKPVWPPTPRASDQRMRDKRTLMDPKHAEVVTKRKEQRLQTSGRGPILDLEGNVMDSGKWIRQIKKVEDPRVFQSEVQKARACNWFTEASVMGVALMHALRSQFPMHATLEPLRGLVAPSENVLTKALSVAIANNHHTHVLEVILEKGAVVDGGSVDQPRPLHQALMSRREDLVDWLLEQGARTDLACPLSNRTTLEVALLSGMGHCVARMRLEIPERVIQVGWRVLSGPAVSGWLCRG